MKKKNKAKRNGKGRKKWNHEESRLSLYYKNNREWDEIDRSYYLYMIGKISYKEVLI